MPCRTRLDAPGTLHHVMIRGIEGKRIFRDTQDREHSVTRLGDLSEQTSNRIPGWFLLENHVHGFSVDSIGFQELSDTWSDYVKSGVDPAQTIHYNEQ